MEQLLTQDELLKSLVSKYNKANSYEKYAPSFLGKYKQNRAKSTIEIRPFTIMQNDEQIGLLEKGIFKGIICEWPENANFEGAINVNAVSFKKTYIPNYNRGMSWVNRNSIIYLGKSEDGANYLGDWYFDDNLGYTSNPSLKRYQDRFSIRDVRDMNEFDLVRICEDFLSQPLD